MIENTQAHSSSLIPGLNKRDFSYKKKKFRRLQKHQLLSYGYPYVSWLPCKILKCARYLNFLLLLLIFIYLFNFIYFVFVRSPAFPRHPDEAAVS